MLNITVDNEDSRWLGLNPYFVIPIIVLLIGALLIHFEIKQEQQRELIQWNDKLNLTIDNQVEHFNGWLDDHVKKLSALANNKSLRIYLSRFIDQAETQQNDIQYIKDLLILSSAELGFHQATPYKVAASIKSNEYYQKSNGLVLVDTSGHILASDNPNTRLPEILKKSLPQAIQNKRIIVRDIIDLNQRSLALGFILPVFPIQTNPSLPTAKPIALLLGIKTINTELDQLAQLSRHQQGDKETLWVKRHHDKIIYLNQQLDRIPAMQRQFAYPSEHLAASSALQQPGKFIEAIDYAGKKVLMTSRPIHYLPWLMMHKVDFDQAMTLIDANSKRRYSELLGGLFLLMLLSNVAVKKFAFDKKNNKIERLLQDNHALNKKNKLLESIATHLNDYLFVVDKQHNLAYSNKDFSNNLASKIEQGGLSLANVVGDIDANKLLSSSTGLNQKYQLQLGNEEKTYLTSHIALSFDQDRDLSMIVAKDLSHVLAKEREKEQLMQQVVVMLSHILEQHDPYSYDHSLRVKNLVVAIGEELCIDQDAMFYLTLSASLLNVGKFFIPKDLLHKETELSSNERQLIQQHTQHTAKLLEEINMDSSVIQAINQSTERIDGTGYPKQLIDFEMSQFAKILAVANSFISMICPRAWRQKMPADKAIQVLLMDPGYDPKILEQLQIIVEKKNSSV